MSKSKLQPKESSGVSNEWLNTYADMVTLMLTFFILLYSFSTIDPVKWDQLVNTYGNAQKSVAGSDKESTDSPSGSVSTPKEQDDGEGSGPLDVGGEVNSIIEDLVEQMKNVGTNREDPELAEQLQEQIAEADLDFFTIYEVIKGYIEENELEAKLDIERVGSYVIIRFKDKAFFDSGRADVKQEALEHIRHVTASIMLVLPKVDSIIVEGHTDNVPQMSTRFPNNWYLSAARSANIIAVLEQYGLPRDMMIINAYADTRPVDPDADNDSDEARAENRRVEVRITRLEDPDAPVEVDIDQADSDGGGLDSAEDPDSDSEAALEQEPQG